MVLVGLVWISGIGDTLLDVSSFGHECADGAIGLYLMKSIHSPVTALPLRYCRLLLPLNSATIGVPVMSDHVGSKKARPVP